MQSVMTIKSSQLQHPSLITTLHQLQYPALVTVITGHPMTTHTTYIHPFNAKRNDNKIFSITASVLDYYPPSITVPCLGYYNYWPCHDHYNYSTMPQYQLHPATIAAAPCLDYCNYIPCLDYCNYYTMP